MSLQARIGDTEIKQKKESREHTCDLTRVRESEFNDTDDTVIQSFSTVITWQWLKLRRLHKFCGDVAQW